MSPVLLLVLIGFSPLYEIGVEANRRNNSHVTSFAISPKMSYQYPDDGETETLQEIIKSQLNSPEARDSLSHSGTVAKSKNYDTLSNSDSLIKEHRVGSGEPKEPKSVYHYYYPASMTSNVGTGKSLSNADSHADGDSPVPSYSYSPSQDAGYQYSQSPDMSYGVPQSPSPSPQYGYPQSPPSSGYDSPAPQPPQSNYGYPQPAPSPAPSTGYGYPAPPAPQQSYGYPAPPAPAPQPSYGYPAAPTDAPAPASGYGYGAPSPKPAPVYGYPAAPQPPPELPKQGGYAPATTDYGYGQGAGDLPSIAVDGGSGGFGGGLHGGDGFPPPATIKGSIDYILIPMILIGIAAPIFVVMYVVLGSMEAKLAPVLLKRSMSWASSIAESWKPTTDALMSTVSRALDQHECWERVACHAGTFCQRHGISSPHSLEKKLEAYVPQSYKRQYRAFTTAMKNSAENCSVYTCP